MVSQKQLVRSKNNDNSAIDISLLREELRSIVDEVLVDYKLESEAVAIKKDSINVPLGIFHSKKLGILEAVVKYLKEEAGLSFKEIGTVLNKDNRMLWSCYAHAKKKVSKRFTKSDFSQHVPVNCFVMENLSCFESICLVLKDNYSYSYHRIAELFDRNYQTIWTTYRRAKAKQNG